MEEEAEGTEEIRKPVFFLVFVVVLEEEVFKMRVVFEGLLFKGKLDLRVELLVGEGFFLVVTVGGWIMILLMPIKIPVLGAQIKYRLLCV